MGDKGRISKWNRKSQSVKWGQTTIIVYFREPKSKRETKNQKKKTKQTMEKLLRINVIMWN